MKILFVTTNMYLPQFFGGLEASLDQICRNQMDKGHAVAVLSSLRHGGWFAWKTLLKMKINEKRAGRKIAMDTEPGYPVWRTWFPWDEIGYVAGREKPDLIVVMGGKVVPTALAAKRTGIPVVTQVHDVDFQLHGGDFGELAGIPCISNSHFTAARYKEAFGVDSTVIYPAILPKNYRTETTRENVTFVNPSAHKGLNIALQIAKLCPDIPFMFVGGGWTMMDKEGGKMMQDISSLPNIKLLPANKDMRKVYAKCKILLAPSIWEEAYGRVVTEAQISGIPVVASSRGGLPEAVGTGGVVLDPFGPIEDWVKTVRKLWEDDKYYAEKSAAALAYAQREEMDYSYKADAREKVFLAACGKSAPAKRK